MLTLWSCPNSLFVLCQTWLSCTQSPSFWSFHPWHIGASRALTHSVNSTTLVTPGGRLSTVSTLSFSACLLAASSLYVFSSLPVLYPSQVQSPLLHVLFLCHFLHFKSLCCQLLLRVQHLCPAHQGDLMLFHDFKFPDMHVLCLILYIIPRLTGCIFACYQAQLLVLPTKHSYWFYLQGMDCVC